MSDLIAEVDIDKQSLTGSLYSDAGCFKTSTIFLAPADWRPIVIFDWDFGALSRKRIMGMTPEQRKAAGVVHSDFYEKAGPWTSKDTIVQPTGVDRRTGKGSVLALQSFVTNVAPKFKTVVVDPCSRIGQYLVSENAYAAEEASTSGKSRAKLNIGGTLFVNPSPADFLAAQARFTEFAAQLDMMDNHTFFLTHERVGELGKAAKASKDGSKVATSVAGGPSIAGSALLKAFPAAVDFCLRIQPVQRNNPQNGKMENRLALRSQLHDLHFQAKDRTGMFEDGVDFDPADFWRRLGNYMGYSNQTEGDS